MTYTNIKARLAILLYISKSELQRMIALGQINNIVFHLISMLF